MLGGKPDIAADVVKVLDLAVRLAEADHRLEFLDQPPWPGSGPL